MYKNIKDPCVGRFSHFLFMHFLHSLPLPILILSFPFHSFSCPLLFQIKIYFLCSVLYVILVFFSEEGNGGGKIDCICTSAIVILIGFQCLEFGKKKKKFNKKKISLPNYILNVLKRHIKNTEVMKLCTRTVLTIHFSS